MGNLRKAAELAFDALDMYREHDAENIGLADAAYEALRQALAQPEWVGLDKSDMNVLRGVAMFTSDADGFIRLVEDNLRRKNT